MTTLAIGLDVDGTLVDRGVHLTAAVRGRRVARILADILAAGISVAIITGNDFERQRRRLAPLFDLPHFDADGEDGGQLWIYADGGTRLLRPGTSGADGDTGNGIRFEEITAYREGRWPTGTDGLSPRDRHDLTDDELGSLREVWEATELALAAELETEIEPVVDVGDRRIEIGPLVDDPADDEESPLRAQLQLLRERFDAAQIPVEIGFDGRRIHIEWVGRDREDVMRALLGLGETDDLPRRIVLATDWWTHLTTPRMEVRGSPGFVSQVAIRPFKRHRLTFLTELRRRLSHAGLIEVTASPGGETTIDVQRSGTTKAVALRDFALRTGIAESAITYIANEFHDTGNDRSVALETDARCLNVGPPPHDLLAVTTIGDGWRATWEHLITLADGLRAVRGR